jgi:hypothetical protein
LFLILFLIRSFCRAILGLFFLAGARFGEMMAMTVGQLRSDFRKRMRLRCRRAGLRRSEKPGFYNQHLYGSTGTLDCSTVASRVSGEHRLQTTTPEMN